MVYDVLSGLNTLLRHVPALGSYVRGRNLMVSPD